MRLPSSGRTRSAVAGVILSLGTLGLAGCGIDEEIALPTALPSASDRPTASVSLPERTTTPSPTRTRPEASADPTDTATDVPAETPTEEPPSPAAPAETPEPSAEPTRADSAIALPPSSESPSEEASSQEPTTEQPTEEPTSGAPTESSPAETTDPPASETPSEEPTSATATTDPPDAGSASASAPPEESGGGVPIWIPIVAVGGLAAGGALLVAARSRRRKWDEALGVEKDQAQWVLGELLPAMSNPTTPPAALAAHWTGAQLTLDQLQAGLDDLLADAPDAVRAEKVRGLGTAVGDVRQSVAADIALRTGQAPPPPGAAGPAPAGPQDATIQAEPFGQPGAGPAGAAQPGPVDPAVLASSSARVAASRDRLAAALATLA